MKTHKIRIGITQGDINGIGYEIIIKTLIDNRILDICTPIVYGSAKVAAYHRKTLNISDFSLNITNHLKKQIPNVPILSIALMMISVLNSAKPLPVPEKLPISHLKKPRMILNQINLMHLLQHQSIKPIFNQINLISPDIQSF